MAANPNQTNINALRTFYGAGGGGSNFPAGIQIQNLALTPNYYFSQNVNCLSVADLSGNPSQFVCNPINVGDYGIGYIAVTSSNIRGVRPATGEGYNWMELDNTNCNFSLTNLSTLTFGQGLGPGTPGPGLINTTGVAFAGSNGLVRILPNTNQLNCQNLVYTSTLNALNTAGTGLAGAINMTELTSTIKGYGWASVMPAVP